MDNAFWCGFSSDPLDSESRQRLIFHQSLWYPLYQIGMIPPERPAWPLEPVPPFGVPSVVSKAFWGGVWGAGLAPFLGRLSGASYWAAWIIVGAVAITLRPRLYYALLVKGAWGFGTALFLKVFGAARDA